MSSTAGETPENLVLHEQCPVSQPDCSTTFPGNTSSNFPIHGEDSTDHANSTCTDILTSVDSHGLRALPNNISGRVYKGAPAETSTPPPGSVSPAVGLAISPGTNLTDNMERFLCISSHDPWTSQNPRIQPGQDTSSHEQPYGISRFLERSADDPWAPLCLGNDKIHVQDVVNIIDRLGLSWLMDHLYIEGTEEIPLRSIMAVLLG
ncbi:hypothetical protein EV426DRAFT_577866 [Tirmania nivea]|nr:hypothetical protein EV426DRAFT_577866 [Tirmania nivea]